MYQLVTSIGEDAFSGCIGLTEINSLASEPPSLGSNAFYLVNQDIPVHVPCNTKETYENDDFGSFFTNIQEDCESFEETFIVTVSTDAVMGTVSNGGEYNNGETATITATANCGYRFIRWFDNNYNIVSTDNPYSFEVTRNISLHAEFIDNVSIEVPSGQTLYFSLDCENGTARVVSGNSELSYSDAIKPSGALSIPNSFNYLGNNYNVIGINEDAFYECTELTSVVIPASVTSIDPSSFSLCSGLESIEVEEGNNVYDSRDNCNAIITSATNTILLGCKNTVIPNSVTSIGNYSFFGSTGLVSMDIPGNVIRIGIAAFSECSNMTSLTLNEGVKYIGESAFGSCSSLTTISIPSSVTVISQEAFAGCYNVASISCMAEVPPSLNYDGEYYNSPFYRIPHGTPIIVPCGKVTDYQEAYGWEEYSNFIQEIDGCAPVVTVVSNDNEMGTVSGGGEYSNGDLATLTATSNCGYQFVRWENENNETVCTEASFSFIVTKDTTLTAVFESAPDMTVNLVCPTGQTLTYTLSCSNTTASVTGSVGTIAGTLTIPDEITFENTVYTVNAIGTNAFANCTGLTSVDVPTFITNIGGDAFLNDNQLRIEYEGNIRQWCEIEFEGGLGTSFNLSLIPADSVLVIPGNVYSINAYAFYACKGLKEVVIPASTQLVGAYNFNSCPDLQKVTFEGSSSFEEYAFDMMPALEKIVFESSTPPNEGPGLVVAQYHARESNNYPFEEVVLKIPCETAETYITSSWGEVYSGSQFSEPDPLFNVNVVLENPAFGDAEVVTGPTCSSLDVTVRPRPAEGYHFMGWSDGITDETRSWTLNGENGDVTPIFEPNDVLISTEGAGDNENNTMGYVVVPHQYRYGETATIWAVPYCGFGFVRWKDRAGHEVSTDNPFSFVVTKDTVLIPEFEPKPTTGIEIMSSTGQTLVYTIICSDSTAIVTGYTGTCAGNLTIPDSIKVDSVTFAVTTIGEAAFAGCIDLSSLTLSNVVKSISDRAFSNCTGLTSMEVMAVVPPIVNGNNVFQNISRDIPVKVPCGTLAQYRAASGWSNFSNIKEWHTVTIGDSYHGSVDVVQPTCDDNTATLTVTADDGYDFVRWNDNNTDNPRNVTVVSDTAFTAYFAVSPVYATVDSNVCENKFPITWNGVMFNGAGNETATLQSHLGGDSILTMTVNVKATSTGDTTATAYDQFTWYGHTYYQSTEEATQLFTNAVGCDSTVTLHLTIEPTPVPPSGSYQITVETDGHGNVAGGGSYDAGETVTLTATADCGYQFKQWSDGSIQNPRTISVTGDASYIAEFELATYTFETPSGQMLNYVIDCETQTACVIGYTGVCRGLLVIPPLIRIEGVIYVVVSIGPSAFEGNTGLIRVMIPGTIDAIYESAFRGCTNLAKVEGWYQLKGLED